MEDASSLPVELLRAMAAGASDAFFVTDEALRIEWVNPRALELLAHAPSELVGRRVSDFFWDDRELAAAPLRRAELVAGKPTITVRRFRTGDGRCVVLEVSAHRIGPGRLLGIARDVTERIAAEDRIARSEASFRALIECSPDCIFVHRRGKIVYANGAAAALLGWPDPGALIGRDAVELAHADDRATVRARVRAIASEATTTPFAEIRLVRHDGTAVACSIGAVHLRFEGQPSIAVIARDLSDLRQAQAHLAENDRLAALGVLAAGVGHEINNPLTYVLLRLDAIDLVQQRLATARDGASALIADLATHVEAAREGARRVRDIVADLRTLSSQREEARVPVDVRKPLQIALGIVGHALKRRARLELVLPPVPPVLASEERLAQVFLNLLLNAAHALPDDGAPNGLVRVEASEALGRVVVAITDSGRGIPREHLPRLFEPFFTTKAPGEGSGLGLAVSHRLVTSIGGTLTVESTEGQGSTFFVSLPITLTRVPTREAKGPRAEAPTTRARVLVVDDEPAIAKAVLGAVGDRVDVEACLGVEEARRMLAEATYDLVLCDVLLPSEDGFALLDWIEREQPSLAARVVMTSGGHLHARARSFAAENPRRWLDKPFDLATLEEIVTRALQAP